MAILSLRRIFRTSVAIGSVSRDDITGVLMAGKGRWMGRANRCSMATSRRNRRIYSRVVNPKGPDRYSGSKETAMQTTRFQRMALARFFVAGWVAFFSAAIAHAQPLYAAPPPPQPPPTFNPSTPYTVPQSPETPVSPGLPSALPRSSVVVSPSGSPPGAVARSHRRPITATGTSNLAKTHAGRHSPQRHPQNWSRGSQTAGAAGGWGVCGAFESANRCNAEWSPRSHRCGCIVR
jgi:hypothetical protein